MQLSQIQSKIDYYLEKYPNSTIALTDSIENEVISCCKGSLLFDLMQMKILSNDVDVLHILHTKDLSQKYQKEKDIIYLLTEEYDIYNCQYCNVVCGDYTDIEYRGSYYYCCEVCANKLDDNAQAEKEHRNSLRDIIFK